MRDDEELETEEEIDFDDEDEERGRVSQLLTYAVPVLAVVVVLSFIGIAVGGKKNKDEAAPRRMEAREVDLNPLEEATLTLPLPFGRKARNDCALACYSTVTNRDSCLRSCDRLLPDEYARRVLPEDTDPGMVARQISADCRTRADSAERAESLDKWKAGAAEARRTLGEIRATVDLYDRSSLLPRFTVLELIEKGMTRPEGFGRNAEAYGSALYSQVCVRESLLAAQLAVVQTAQTRDLFSEKFYRALEKGLLAENSRLEQSLKDLVEKLQ